MRPLVALEPNLPGPENMARDATLIGEPIAARVYSWDGPWVSLGMFQDSNRDLLPDNPVPSVMRPTGGRAVLHGHDVTVGLSALLTILDPTVKLSRSVRTVYRIITQPLLDALSTCGVDACLGENLEDRHTGPRSADCFAAISANDIVDRVTLQKVCGCALKLTSDAVLIQASIPAGSPLVDPALVYAHPAPVHWRDVNLSDFAQALTCALEVTFCARN